MTTRKKMNFKAKQRHMRPNHRSQFEKLFSFSTNLKVQTAGRAKMKRKKRLIVPHSDICDTVTLIRQVRYGDST